MIKLPVHGISHLSCLVGLRGVAAPLGALSGEVPPAGFKPATSRCDTDALFTELRGHKAGRRRGCTLHVDRAAVLFVLVKGVCDADRYARAWSARALCELRA